MRDLPGPLVAARGCRGLIAPIGDEACELLLRIAASGDVSGDVSGDEVSDVALCLRKHRCVRH